MWLPWSLGVMQGAGRCHSLDSLWDARASCWKHQPAWCLCFRSTTYSWDDGGGKTGRFSRGKSSFPGGKAKTWSTKPSHRVCPISKSLVFNLTSFPRTVFILKPLTAKLLFPRSEWGSRRENFKFEKVLICPGSFSLRLCFYHLMVDGPGRILPLRVFILHLHNLPVCTLIFLWLPQTHPHPFLAFFPALPLQLRLWRAAFPFFTLWFGALSSV